MNERSAILEQIRRHPAVAHAKPWKDRISIDVRGKLAFKGEQYSRVWLRDDQLIIRRADGHTSATWEHNLASLCSWLRSKGIKSPMS